MTISLVPTLTRSIAGTPMTDKSLARPVLLARPDLLTPPVRPAVTTERQVPLKGAGENGNSRNSLNSLIRLTPEDVAARNADNKRAADKQANFKKTNSKKAKPVKQVDVEKLKAEKAAANQLVEKIRDEVLQGKVSTVSCVFTGKATYGVFYRVTTPGATFGLTGLLHVSDMPGGATDLAAIAVNAESTENKETAMELDIIGARVENSGRYPIVKLSFNFPQSA
jgi:hypothetical protein